MRIGVAGLGKMGHAMAERLLETGHELWVWNRSQRRADTLQQAGATVVPTPRALAEGAEVILSSLFDAAAVEAVFDGADGLLAGEVGGKLFLEMSTVRPQTQERLAEAARARGAAYVECPVGGTTGPARSGQLLGLAGGEAADIARVRPVLDALCRRVEHVGPAGAGAAMKLAINLPLLVFWQAFGEANALIRPLGLDPGWLVSLFADSSGGPNVLKGRGPAIAKALAGEDPGPVTFDVDAIRKDLRTMLEEAEARGFTLPVAGQALSVFDEADAAGWGKRDSACLPHFWASKGTARPKAVS